MPEQLILGPWTGAVTANSATLKAFITKGAAARLTLNAENGSTAANPLPATSRTAAGSNWEVVAFALAELQPNVEYRYTLKLDNEPEAAQRGRFRTFPPPDTPASFTFICGGDAGGGFFSSNSNHEVFDVLRKEAALFFLHLGDMHYGDIDEADVVKHLEGYRKTLRQSRQAAFFRQFPFAYIWDDHDFCGNASNGQSPGCQAARLAYQVGIPHYKLEAGDGDVPIYQAFTIGRVRFLLTDTRSARIHRSAAEGPHKTILGAEQKAWLKDQLLAGKDRYSLIVWVSSAPWLGGLQHFADNEDGWANYRTERAELGSFIEAEGIRNLLMLCADAHMVAIDDGTFNRGKTGAGRFPIFHAAPLDRSNSRKGGEYSHGVFDDHRGQYGLVEIKDEGGQPAAQVKLIGKHMGSELVSFPFTSPRP